MKGKEHDLNINTSINPINVAKGYEDGTLVARAGQSLLSLALR